MSVFNQIDRIFKKKSSGSSESLSREEFSIKLKGITDNAWAKINDTFLTYNERQLLYFKRQ